MIRKYILNTLLLYLICLLPVRGQAQLLSLERQRMIVYTFEEFTKTFNGKQSDVSVLRKFPKLMNLERIDLIPMLFNPMDSIPVGEVKKFSLYVSQWDYKIDMDSVSAIVDLHYTDVKGKDIPMKAQMVLEKRDEGYVWIMRSVESLQIFLGDTTEIGLIGITSSEVEFQEFGRNAGANPTDIAGKNYKPDNVTLFLYLTANKLIKYDYSENVRFLFNLGDYSVKVSHIVNKDYPTMGWLITGLTHRGKLVFGDMD